MAALTAARNTVEKDNPAAFSHEPAAGVATATTIYQGSIVCFNSSGYLVPGSTATTLKAAGVAQEGVVNAGANGAAKCKLRSCVAKFANSSAGDLITIADVGADCYIVDDQTVAKTSGGSTRSVAGKVFEIAADGVFVKIGLF
jgi:hypothetical protein